MRGVQGLVCGGLAMHSPPQQERCTGGTYGWQLAHGSELVIGGVNDEEDAVVLFTIGRDSHKFRRGY